MTTFTGHPSDSEASLNHPHKDAFFWSSSKCARQTGKSSEADAPEPGSIVLVGPPKSGKSSFLGALGHAYEANRDPAWKSFVAGRSLATLMHSPSTVRSRWETYCFQLEIAPVGSGIDAGVADEMEVSVLDTPGDFFNALAAGHAAESERAWVDDLLRATLTAHCLVLCCSASEGGRIDLTRFVSSLLSMAPRRLKRLIAKPWPRRESPLERVPRLELPFDRVLLLLTGIETLCTEASRQIARRAVDWRHSSSEEIRAVAAYRGLSLREIASLLDLSSLAERRVQGFDLLAASLKPGARLAVCGVSTGLGERSRPFGVWPALLFMTTGRVVAPLSKLEQRSREIGPWTCLDASPALGGKS